MNGDMEVWGLGDMGVGELGNWRGGKEQKTEL